MAHRAGFPKLHASKRTVRRWIGRYYTEKPKGKTQTNRTAKALQFVALNPTWKKVIQ